MRTAFIETLYQEALKDEKIFLLVGDLGFSVVEDFKEQFSERFLNVGVAEQNMAGVAAGLAREGFKVFVYSIANFPTFRCLEQIRYDICYHNLDVTIVSVGAGFAYGALGGSHHATEDIGALRVIPNMNVYMPSDPEETSFIVKEILKNKGPSYLRLGRAREEVLIQKYDYKLGLNILRESSHKKIIISTGSISSKVLNLNKYSDYSIATINNLNLCAIKELQELIQSGLSEIIVFEEHQKQCGLYSFLSENLIELYSHGKVTDLPKVFSKSLNGFTNVAGTQDYLRTVNGLL